MGARFLNSLIEFLVTRNVQGVLFVVGSGILGGPVRHWAPGRRVRHYDYWQTFLYFDWMVLTVANEKERLASSNRRAQIEIERLRAMRGAQGARIRGLEVSILEEQERTNAF